MLLHVEDINFGIQNLVIKLKFFFTPYYEILIYQCKLLAYTRTMEATTVTGRIILKYFKNLVFFGLAKKSNKQESKYCTYL